MSHILIVGQKYPYFIEYLKSHGHTYTLLRDKSKQNPNIKPSPRVAYAHLDNERSINAALAQLPIKPDAVIAFYENFLVIAAEIAAKLGLPGMPVSAARACTDKFLMRTLFGQAPEKISPDYAAVTSHEELLAFAKSHSFPLILKPTNLAKSLLVTKNHNLEELEENYKKALRLLDGAYKKYAPNKKPGLIIEEFMKGSIHSVDAFVDKNGRSHILEQIVDYETGYDVGYDDNFHYSRLLPSKLSNSDQSALRHCAEVGITALGIKSSPAHVEIIMTQDGPRIVEIGARNGGYRERMHLLANGIDITGSALDLKLGNKPQITATKEESCAVLELFPKKPGLYKGIRNIEKLDTLPSLDYINVKVEPGQHVGKAGDGHKMCAVVMLHNSDATQFAKDLAFVRDSVFVETATE